MATLSINTTQNVNIDFTAASVGERILAFLLDMIFKGAYVFVIFYILGNAGFYNLNIDDYTYFAFTFFILLPVIFYTLIFETLLSGQTPGKKILKIKVIKIDGFEAGLPEFIARWIFRIIDLYTLSGILAFISIIFSEKSQRFGDMVAGTSVISLKNKNTIQHTILMNLEDEYKPVYPQAAFLTDEDARIIKSVFDNAIKNKNMNTIYKLKDKIVSILKIDEPNTDEINFINDILRDFNYYTQGDNSYKKL